MPQATFGWNGDRPQIAEAQGRTYGSRSRVMGLLDPPLVDLGLPQRLAQIVERARRGDTLADTFAGYRDDETAVAFRPEALSETVDVGELVVAQTGAARRKLDVQRLGAGTEADRVRRFRVAEGQRHAVGKPPMLVATENRCREHNGCRHRDRTAKPRRAVRGTSVVGAHHPFTPGSGYSTTKPKSPS